MNSKPNTPLKRIYAYTFLLLFLGYFACVTLFYHTHVVFGETISHSHPYKSNSHGVPIHSHTNEGFITIHVLSCITVTLHIFTFILIPLAPVIFKIEILIKEGFSVPSFNYIYSLRAPPQEMFQ